MKRLIVACLLAGLVSCKASNVGQHACLPLGPLVPLAVPHGAILEEYVQEVQSAALQRWPRLDDVPNEDELEGLTVSERQQYTLLRILYPYDPGLISAAMPTGLSLTTFSGLGDEHSQAAGMIAEWFNLVPAPRAIGNGRVTYHFRSDPRRSRSQLLWLVNRALQQFPQCFVYGDVWYAHSEGIGSGI